MMNSESVYLVLPSKTPPCRLENFRRCLRNLDLVCDHSLPGTCLHSAPVSPFLPTDRARHDLSKMVECPSDTAPLPTDRQAGRQTGSGF